mmetsp:Transcript_58462/g.130592  ORF Transcript_58462/g.130592 Transcript_58462/m.130592 type:complete len:288 (+) Transcript_58462:40-903(+)
MAPKVRKGTPALEKEPPEGRSVKLEDEMAAQVEDGLQPGEKNTTFLQRTPSATNQAASEAANDRRLMGAAATIGGAAGALLAGPVSSVALGAAALYATTREDGAGTMARKAGSVYLNVADSAIDEGLRAVDHGVKVLGQAVDRGCRELEDNASVPAVLRTGLQRWRRQGQSGDRCAKAMAEEATKILAKYPDRVPVICEKSARSTLPELPKNKFVVHGSMLCGEFKYMVGKNIVDATPERLSVDQTIYLFVNGITPKTSTPMSQLYDQFKASDGFLYIRYGAENTLG